jgi:hypothetical protein
LPKARRVIALCAKVWESVGALLTLGQGCQGLKTPKNVKKFQKLKFKFDNYAEYDGVRSQSAHETNQMRSEPGLKQSRDRTRSMRRKIQTRSFDLSLSPQWSRQFLL